MTTIEIETIDQHHLLFDASNLNWTPQPEYNLAFIRSTVQYLQQRLAAREFLFVNEVLDAFGFDWTPDGQVSGWLRREGYLVIETYVAEDQLWIKFKPQGVVVNALA